jgi:hypothetical protein
MTFTARSLIGLGASSASKQFETLGDHSILGASIAKLINPNWPLQ